MCMSKETVQKIVTLESVAATVEKVVVSVDTMSGSIKSLNESMGILTKRIDDLPTRKEMTGALDSMEKRLEKQIDDLAISTSNEFGRVHKKFDEVCIRFNGVDEQIGRVDTHIDDLAILTSKEIRKVYVKLEEMNDNLVDFYAKRKDLIALDKRVHGLEKIAFA